MYWIILLTSVKIQINVKIKLENKKIILVKIEIEINNSNLIRTYLLYRNIWNILQALKMCFFFLICAVTLLPGMYVRTFFTQCIHFMHILIFCIFIFLWFVVFRSEHNYSLFITYFTHISLFGPSFTVFLSKISAFILSFIMVVLTVSHFIFSFRIILILSFIITDIDQQKVRFLLPLLEESTL